MRLRDPLQGIKMGVGHLMVHWVFFFTNMVFVHYSEDENIPGIIPQAQAREIYDKCVTVCWLL